MASISKKTGITGIRWQVRIRKSSGLKLTRTFATKLAAKNWALSSETAIQNGFVGVLPESSALRTMGDLLERYLTKVTPLKKGLEPEQYRLKKLIQHPLAAVPLKSITSTHLARYRDERLEVASSGSVIRELGLISSAIEIGRREWGIAFQGNPASLIRKPKAPRPRDRRLEEGEEEILLSCCPSPWFSQVVTFALETGMRRGEILSLTWGQVHLQGRYACLEETKNGEKRNVPLSPRALELLASLPGDMEEDHFLFPVHFEALKSAWQRACSKTGITNLRFHDLRHEATSRFFEKGLNVMEVAAITGHRDLKMLQRYTHLRAEDLARKLE